MSAIFPTQSSDGALLALGRHLQQSDYRFTTISPSSHRRVNARPNNAWARNISDVLGWSRPFRSGVLAPAVLELMQSVGILSPHEDGWRSSLRASTIGTLLFFHSAYPTTETDAVFFGPDTYRFARALESCMPQPGSKIRRAVDIGCGSGAGAVILARRFAGAEVIGADINEQALRLARINSALAGATNVRVTNSNLLRAVDGQFDLIVSNPPYVLDFDERAYRHGGGELGTGLSLEIVDAAIERLAPGGTLLLYTGVAMVDGTDPFLRDARQRLDRAGFSWTYDEIDPDIFGQLLGTDTYGTADRIAAVLLRAERRQC